MPDIGVRLDQSHAFSKQALTVIIPGAGSGVYDAVTSTVTTTGATGIEVSSGRSGRALRFNTGTAGTRYRLPTNGRRITGFGASNTALHHWTRIHLVTPLATGVFQLLSTSAQTTDGSVGTGITCRVSTTGTLAFDHGGVANLATTSNAIPWVVGQESCIVVRHNGTSFVAFINGKKFTCPSYSISNTPGPSMAGIWLGREDSDSTRFSGKYSLFADSSYLVTDDEGLKLSLDPWAIFESPLQVFPSGGSGGTNVTVDGQTVTSAATIVAGAVSVTANVTSAGVTLVAAATLIGGGASAGGSVTVDGKTLTAAGSIIAGAVTTTQSITVSGITASASATLLGGGASTPIPGIGGNRRSALSLGLGIHL